MTLQIAEPYPASDDLETIGLSTDMMKCQSVHLFLASHKWDKVIVNMCDEIPSGSLKYIHTVCEDIRVHMKEAMTETTMKLLTELFPDKAGAIRRVYMSGGSLEGVVPLC